MDVSLTEKLVTGRSFSVRALEAEANKDATRCFAPEKFAEGYEDVFSFRDQMVTTVKLLDVKEDFQDDEQGLGRINFLFHLDGERSIDVQHVGTYQIKQPAFIAYSQAPGVPKRSCWTKGSRERAVIVGYASNEPPKAIAEAYRERINQISLYSDGADPFRWIELPLSFDMHHAASQMVEADIDPRLRREFIRAKSTELLCLGFHAILNASQDQPASAGERDFRLRTAEKILSYELSTNFCLEDIALRVGMPPRDFSHAFQQKYGVSFADFSLRTRMETARSSLLTTVKPIKQIAYDVGYSHSSNFAIAFKKYFGITPKSLR
jgi:AraC-like DNA-binding protein